MHVLTLEGDEPEPISLATFLAVNAETLTDDDRAALEALDVGESHTGGGGAAPTWTVRRAP